MVDHKLPQPPPLLLFLFLFLLISKFLNLEIQKLRISVYSGGDCCGFYVFLIKGLAGLKSVAVRVVVGSGCYRQRKRSNNNNKRKLKVKEKLMDWWHKMIFPVKRVWFAVSSRIKPRNNGAGLLKLHNDVQTCGYEDVQVMWEMLRRSESEQIANHPKRKQRSFWKVLVWSNHSASSSFPANHA